jgi:hypothetical protein
MSREDVAQCGVLLKVSIEATFQSATRLFQSPTRSSCKVWTLYHRDYGRPSREAKAQGQLYLTPSEEKALEKHLILMADLGNPVRIKCLPTLAFSIAFDEQSGQTLKGGAFEKTWSLAFVYSFRDCGG